jgi:hypothetical protein
LNLWASDEFHRHPGRQGGADRSLTTPALRAFLSPNFNPELTSFYLHQLFSFKLPTQHRLDYSPPTLKATIFNPFE